MHPTLSIFHFVYYEGESAATQWINQTISQRILLTHYVEMCPDAPYFIILLCLTPDDLLIKGRTLAATRWINIFQTLGDLVVGLIKDDVGRYEASSQALPKGPTSCTAE